MTADVVPYAQSDQVVPLEARHRWITLLGEVSQLAHAIANTDFVPKAMRGNEAAITAAILYGDEVGLTPMQSLAKIAIIDGKPSMAAEAQRALILKAGHNIWPEEQTVSKVTYAGRRRDFDQVVRVTWTLDDARRAGLAGKFNWKNYPRAMLAARASAELARALFSDVIGGLAATEELEDVDGAPQSAPAPAAAEQPKTTRRRRAATPAPAVITPPPQAADEPPAPPLPDETDQEQPAAPGMTEPQQRKLFALFRERGIDDRTERLAWANQQLDRVITSASELTSDEASRLIDALDAGTQLNTGDQE